MKKNISLCFFALLITSTFAARTGSPCQVTDDCPNLHECLLEGSQNVCVHKELFPITAVEVIGTLVILTMNALLTAGGVGGGAAYVPYIMIFFSVTLQKAIGIAYTCVFGGGVGNLVNIITLRNPKTKRFMINYDINLIILPALMVGVMIGLILNRIFPPLVTNIILLLVLAYSFIRNVTKVRVNLVKEKKERAMKKAADLENAKTTTQGIALTETEIQKDDENAAGTNADETMTLKSPKEKSVPAVSYKVDLPSTEEETEKKDLHSLKRKELYKQQQKFPYHKLIELLLNVLAIIIIGLIRGTKNFDPVVGVDWSCGWDFGWFAAGIILFGLLSVRSVYLVTKWQKEKQEVGYEFLPEEPVLNKNRIAKLVFVAIVAGIIGAIIALGGALVTAPTLLDMGLPPAFSAVTTGVFMIFSMFNSMFQTILNGRLTGEELAWFLPLAFVFSFISSKLVNFYVKKTGRQSVVIMTVMLVTALGFGCVMYNMINGLVEDSKLQTTFTSVC